MRLEDKKALITGGSRGIGRACVAKMAAEGATVAFVYQSNRDAAESLAEELRGRGHEVRAVQADVRDAERVHQVVDELVEQWQTLDILVNSAGIVRDGLLGAMTAEQWRDVIETNLGGTYNYCHAVVQQMMYQRRRQHRQPVEHGRRVRLPRPGQLRGQQGRHRRPDPRAGQGVGPAQDPRQRRGAGHDRDRHERGGPRPGRATRSRSVIPLKRIGQPEEIATRGGVPGQRRCELPDRPGPSRRRRD